MFCCESGISETRNMNRCSNRPGWGLMVAWGLLLALTPCVPAVGAETFGYTSRRPQLWETERPVLETEPGTNLYWHDPHLASWETCRIWPPATNGCMPTWYAKAELLALYRDVDNDVTVNPIGPLADVDLSTADFRTDFSPGVRATIGRTLGTWYRIEGSYFGSYSWDDTAFDVVDGASIDFESTLHSGELNLRRRVLMRPGQYEASFLVGGRYLDIDETFGYEADFVAPLQGLGGNSQIVQTDNSMYGVQVGMLSQFLMQPKCWIDFDMKGGIFTNRATLERTYTVTADTGAILGSATSLDEIDRTSFAGELSLQFNYQFAPSWTFFAGYNALWVTGLAIAAENYDNSIPVLTSGAASIDHSGEVVYHGPNIGLVFTH